MGNWIANNCKAFSHRVLLCVFCFLNSYALAASTSINVYLKLKPQNQVSTLIKEFNQFLTVKGVIKKYKLEPFIIKHPLHVTLYLATYHEKQIAGIIKQTEALAKHKKQLLIISRQFNVNASGYIALPVTNSKELQLLSNKMVYSLSGMRDTKALIPTWAANNKERCALFNIFGSPNVLSYFNPHFSVMDPDHLNKAQKEQLIEKLRLLIQQFNRSHPKPVEVVAYGIGVGKVDQQGQIIKELAWFELKQ